MARRAAAKPVVDVGEVARTRLQAARAKAIGSVAPYFGTALSSMVMHEVPGLGTVATDTRWRFYYDPEVVAGWSVGECVAAWLHEVKHQLHRHAERFEALGEPRERHLLFNTAGDALINEDLRDMAHRIGDRTALQMGDGWVYLETLPVDADRDMPTEQIYRLLVDNAEQPGLQGGAGSGPGDGAPRAVAVTRAPGSTAGAGRRDCGSGAGSARVDRWWELPADDGSDGSVDEGRGQLIGYETARQVSVHIKQHGIGSVPGGLARWAEQVLQPAVDWRTELRSVVSNRCAAVAGRRDYTYARPNRRRPLDGVVMPGMVAPAPPSGALVLDTSGSMTDDELAQGVAEVAGILKQVSRGRSTLQVISCDHAAADAQLVRKAADVELVGGGGTDMRIGIDAAAALRPKADFVVVFTDGLTPWPDAPPAANPGARYIAVLSDGPVDGVPDWMRTIVVDQR